MANAIRTEGDVLVGVGAHFGIEHHLRITHGLESKYFESAMQRIIDVLRESSSAGLQWQHLQLLLCPNQCFHHDHHPACWHRVLLWSRNTRVATLILLRICMDVAVFKSQRYDMLSR